MSASLPEGAKVFVIVQASGRVIARYHCAHKVGGQCGVAGTCNLPVDTLEGAKALQIECDKIVVKLEAGATEVAFLLADSDKKAAIEKYRKASAKHAAKITSIRGSAV